MNYYVQVNFLFSGILQYPIIHLFTFVNISMTQIFTFFQVYCCCQNIVWKQMTHKFVPHLCQRVWKTWGGSGELFGLCETKAVCLNISRPEICPAAKLSLQNTRFHISRRCRTVGITIIQTKQDKSEEKESAIWLEWGDKSNGGCYRSLVESSNPRYEPECRMPTSSNKSDLGAIFIVFNWAGWNKWGLW